MPGRTGHFATVDEILRYHAVLDAQTGATMMTQTDEALQISQARAQAAEDQVTDLLAQNMTLRETIERMQYEAERGQES